MTHMQEETTTMPCRMTQAPLKAWHNWIVPEGATVTLYSRGTIGRVRIARAHYNGEVLDVSEKIINGERVTAIDVTGVDSRKNLMIIYGFSSGASGRGVLQVHCGGHSSKVIDDFVIGDEPLRIYRLGPERQ